MRIAIAPPDFDQWDSLLALITDAFRYMEPLISPPSSAKILTPISLKQKAEKEILLLATQDNDLIGCSFLRIEPTYLYIGKIAISEFHQRQGIGGKFIRQAEHIAKSHRLPQLKLQTRIELAQNHYAFQRLGFVKTGETTHPGYSQATSITMTKYLDVESVKNDGATPNYSRK